MFIDSGDAKLYAVSSGATKGLTIVGIGGWIGSSELWAEPFSILSASWRTIAYDHRGSGASVAPVESITFENLVADLLRVLDACGVERCVLAAESAGALTALAAAARYPQRVARLVIVDGMYHRGVDPASDPFLQGLRTAYGATLDRFVELCVPEPDSAHLKRWGRQIVGRADPAAAIALRVCASEVDIRESLPGIRQPTLIIHGDGDVIVPIQQAHELAALIPDSRLVVLEGAGHVPTVTRPAAIAQAMTNFLLERA
ncbi:MAG: alpha/beta fold hydrolase [Pseudomonadota bacterium]